MPVPPMRHNLLMRRALPLSLILLAFAMAGCRKDEAVTISAPRPEKVYTSVVSLSPSTTEVVARFASGEMLKGRTAACDYPPPVKQVPVVASVKPEYEKIAKIKPDLVLYDALLYSESDVAKIKGTGDTFAFTANTLDGFLDELAELGGLLLQETSVPSFE